MKYQIFRYFLVPTQPSLLPKKDSIKIEKQDLVNNLLLEKIDFSSLRGQFSYRLRKVLNTNITIGDIGKRINKKRELKEEDIFVTKNEEEWPYVHAIFNTNKDIQVVALGMHPEQLFISGTNALEGWADEANKYLTEYGWNIVFEPITEDKTFWSLINENQGSIQKVKFTYNVPNIWGAKDSLTKEMASARDINGAQEIEYSMTNREGNLVVVDTEPVKEGLDYISKGGGHYSIQLKNVKKCITSKEQKKTIDIDEVTIETTDKTTAINTLENLLKL